MKHYILFLFLLLSGYTYAQELTGTQLLEKAIKHHDPNNAWPSFKGQLFITMKTPKGIDRISEISIDLIAEHFKLISTRDTTKGEYHINKDSCLIRLNGDTIISDEAQKKHGISCERGKMMKNYYTYLYGLPMKLKDPGTHIDPKVMTKTFKGKEYLVLKASYDEAVGTDVWFFYFDPTTYAMEVYQFYKGDPEGIGKNTGEYILLEGEAILNGIRMPKTRKWYYNKDDNYLGTDVLTKTERL